MKSTVFWGLLRIKLSKNKMSYKKRRIEHGFYGLSGLTRITFERIEI